MSTKKIQEALETLGQYAHGYGNVGDCNLTLAAKADLEAIRKAAADLTRLHLGDGADNVAHREHVIEAMTTPESQWNHPDVVAWAEAARLLAAIAKEHKP